MNTIQRPKLEDFGAYVFITMKMIDYDDKTTALSAIQISFVFGAHFLVSFQEGGDDPFDQLRRRMRVTNSRTRRSGADYLACVLIDIVIVNYFLILDKLGERVEVVEEDLVRNPQPKILKVIHNPKKDLIFLRRSVWPLRGIINRLINEDSFRINDSTQPYLRDVFDHTIHAIETIETFRLIVSGLLDIYLSTMSNGLKKIMKALTIMATIFIPLMFL